MNTPKKHNPNLFICRLPSIKLMLKLLRARTKACAQALLILIMFLGILSQYKAFSAAINSVVISSTGSIRYTQDVMSPLHTDGRWIKDENNNTVILRGIFKGDFPDTVTGWWPLAGHSATEGYYDFNEQAVRDHLSAMRNWGANVLHTYLWVDWWIRDAKETLGGATPTSHSQRYCIRRVIEIAQEYGIYVSFRWYGVYRGGGDAASGGVVHCPYPTSFASPPAHDGVVIPDRETFAQLWGGGGVDGRGNAFPGVADVLGDLPNVIFHMYDEPIVDSNHWAETCEMCIDAIRAVEDANGFPRHLIEIHEGYCGPVTYADAHVARYPDKLTGVVFTSHIYRVHGTFPSGGQTVEAVKNDLTNWGYLHVTNDLNVPLVVTAMGAYATTAAGPPDDEYNCIVNTLQVLNEWQLGYSAYKWHRPETGWMIQEPTGIAVQPPNRVGQAFIDAIASG